MGDEGDDCGVSLGEVLLLYLYVLVITDVMGVGEDEVSFYDESGADALGHCHLLPGGDIVEVLADGADHNY